MGRKIFVSYKYSDDSVANLSIFENSTVRNYVNKFEQIVGSSDDIYKGESDDEDLSEFEDDTIWEKLKDRIYDSSVTIVFISPNMKEIGVSERNQWIPWEISYSLKEVSRRNSKGNPITGRTNAVFAVVLPDAKGSYSYYLESNSCCTTGCITHHTEKLFTIIKKNKFNYSNPNKVPCASGSTIWHGKASYIEAVKWEQFIGNYGNYVDAACSRRDAIDDYEITKEI